MSAGSLLPLDCVPGSKRLGHLVHSGEIHLDDLGDALEGDLGMEQIDYTLPFGLHGKNEWPDEKSFLLKKIIRESLFTSKEKMAGNLKQFGILGMNTFWIFCVGVL